MAGTILRSSWPPINSEVIFFLNYSKDNKTSICPISISHIYKRDKIFQDHLNFSHLQCLIAKEITGFKIHDSDWHLYYIGETFSDCLCILVCLVIHFLIPVAVRLLTSALH